MNEFIEKLIGRLEEYKYSHLVEHDKEMLEHCTENERAEHCESIDCFWCVWNKSIEIVNQLAEEYNNEAVKGDLISKKAVITELNGIYLDNPWDDKEDILEKAIGIVDHFPTAYNNGWIPCSERLPGDCDNRFYMCIVENHEEDLPMFCQYDEEYGFGFWRDIYDEHTLGFVDSEFKTNEELGYEKVIAWQPLPEPFKPIAE